MNKKRTIFFFENYFNDFYAKQSSKVKNKIIWTLKIIEEFDRIPDTYLKYLTNSSGIYEIRVKSGSNIYRIFCFFDAENLVIIGHGFHKKTNKIPKKELEKAERIKKEYYDTKK